MSTVEILYGYKFVILFSFSNGYWINTCAPFIPRSFVFCQCHFLIITFRGSKKKLENCDTCEKIFVTCPKYHKSMSTHEFATFILIFFFLSLSCSWVFFFSVLKLTYRKIRFKWAKRAAKYFWNLARKYKTVFRSYIYLFIASNRLSV